MLPECMSEAATRDTSSASYASQAGDEISRSTTQSQQPSEGGADVFGSASG
jgi:hypothetical protein